MNSLIKGAEREKSIEKNAYLNASYFDLRQLCTYAHQINDIYNLHLNQILEIGIGNGFTSHYLKNAGFDVMTVDINCKLNPDLCCGIDEVEDHVKGKKFDLVVCCEVLEHLPFSEFESILKIFRRLSKNLYITLPNYNRVFGFGGFVKLLPKKVFSLKEFMIEVPNTKKLDYEHFWEVGSSNETKKKQIKNILEKYYANVECKRYALNSYHIAFTASS